MYSTSEEARSDLFLSVAVYLFGPLLLGFLAGPLLSIPVLGLVLALLLPAVYTVLVPGLLIRYRKERLADFGLAGSATGMARGLLVAAPLVVAAALAGLLTGPGPLGGIPLVGVALGLQPVVTLLFRAVFFTGLALLAVYATVKARDAFRTDPSYLRHTYVELGRIVAGVAAVATVLLLLSYAVNGGLDTRPELPLLPLAVAVAGWLAYRVLRPSQLTGRAVLLTPLIVFALGAFNISLNAVTLVDSIWRASLLGGVGLVMGAQVESERSAWAPLGLGVALGLLTSL
ncbi:MAG: hypothetical protein H0V19_08630 [Euzebyales bacterium]|nr:hypothetical protein [Euzebyales bacterium]